MIVNVVVTVLEGQDETLYERRMLVDPPPVVGDYLRLFPTWDEGFEDHDEVVSVNTRVVSFEGVYTLWLVGIVVATEGSAPFRELDYWDPQLGDLHGLLLKAGWKKKEGEAGDAGTESCSETAASAGD